MIDIVDFDGEMFSLGFTKIYHKRDFNIAFATDNVRRLAEDRNIDILFNVESVNKGRNLVTRNSGLNDAICKIASKNNVAIGFSISNLLNASNRTNIIANISQNIRLCRKYKVRMVIASMAKNKYEMRHARDMMNLGMVLGMTDNEAKEALNFKKKEIMPRFV